MPEFQPQGFGAYEQQRTEKASAGNGAAGKANTRPTITVANGRRHDAADDGLAALAAAGAAFYQRDRSLVRVCRVKAKASDGAVVTLPAVVPVTAAMLGRALGQSARWERRSRKGEVFAIDPPRAVVDEMSTMVDEWPFPPLFGVIATQTMRPDGSLLTVEGYDATTGFILFAPPSMPAIPDAPTKQDALNALATLKDLFAEFPFADKPSKSVALSMVMTPVLRPAVQSAVPIHSTTAPSPGTGKSYLGDIAAAVATGDRCPVMAMSANEEETEKRLVGAALAQCPIIAIDNVSVLLFGDFLNQASERPILQLRRLGSSDLFPIANTYTIFANGNNLTVGADTVRRTIRCALDAGIEHPEDRTFKADPVAMVLTDRGKYVAACLTIARAYIAAGQPDRLSRRASYEGWSDLVRSALVWLGEADPVDSVANMQASDPTREQRAAVFTAWRDELQIDTGYQTGELIKFAGEFEFSGDTRTRPNLWNALFAVAAPHSGHPQIDPRRLGKWLASNVNTIVGELKLTVDRNDAARPRWRMVTP